MHLHSYSCSCSSVTNNGTSRGALLLEFGVADKQLFREQHAAPNSELSGLQYTDLNN